MMRISHTTFAVSVAIVATMAIAGCKNNTQEKMPQDSSTVGMTPPTPTTAAADTGKGMAMNTPASGPLTDANIFAKIDAANSEEIDEGKVGSEKAKNADVKKFAQMLV